MKNIVVTYFEPFGGRTTNASKEVVSLLDGFQIKELPVSWNKVFHCLNEIFLNEPDYLFLVGEAGSYKEITIETTAHNISNGKDNDGINKDNEKIIKDASDLLITKFDLSKLNYLKSEDAGKYLCNYSYYLALSKAKNCKVLFIHLPYVDENGANSLDNLKNDLFNIIDLLTN